MRFFNARRARVYAIAAALVLAILPMLSTPATAEDTAGNWAEVAQAQDPCAKWNPLREGYYNLSTDKGWGFAKMSYKHYIYNTLVWMDTIRDSCGVLDQPGSTTWIYRTGFAHKVCSNGDCVITDSVVVRTVVQRAMFNGLRKGAITAYCEGYQGFCPAWLDAYDGDSAYMARKVTAVEADDVVTFTPESMKPRGKSDAVGLPGQALTHAADASTRAGQILRLLDSDLRQLTRAFEVDIVEARQAGPNTVEVIYRYPGYDGLLGLRRDVSEQEVGLLPGDRFYALAKNENSPREMATMLRVELEEPPRPDSFTTDAAGIQWRGSPSQ